MKPKDVITNKISKQDKGRLEEFYYSAYGSLAQYKFPESWEWLYENNPWKNDLTPHVFIAKSSDEAIVGHLGAIRVPCKIFNDSIKLGWGVQYIVLPDWRGKGIGKKLVRMNQEDNDLFAGIGMTLASKHIMLKSGASLGPERILYAHFASFSYKNQYFSIYQKLVQSAPSFLSHLLTCLLFPLTIIAYFFLRYLQIKSKQVNIKHEYIICEKEAKFDRESDNLWSLARKRYDFAVERYSQYLNWRYSDIPWCKYFIVEARDKKGLILGQIVYRLTSTPEPEIGIITELIDENSDYELLRVLITETLLKLINKGAKQIIIASSDQPQQKAIEASGFLLVGKNPLVCYSKRKKVIISHNMSALLTIGDQDMEHFPYPKEVSTFKPIFQYFRKKKP